MTDEILVYYLDLLDLFKWALQFLFYLSNPFHLIILIIVFMGSYKLNLLPFM